MKFEKRNPIVVNTDKILLNDSNPRIIKDSKFKSLVESLKEFPKMLEMRPIIVNENMMVLGGNMRLRAAIEVGYKSIPVIVAGGLTEKEQRALIVKDNVSYGEWDWEILANEWDTNELQEWGLDIPSFETIDEIEAKGRMAATLDEKLDTYLNATIKQIVLYYEYEEYEKILVELNKIAEDNNLEDNSSTIAFLVENYKK